MEALTLGDTQKLLESIHSLHCLKNPQTFVRDVLVLLEQLVPVGAACAMTHQLCSAEMLALLEQEAPPEEHDALVAQQVNVLSDCTIHSADPGFARFLTEDLFPLFERFLPDSPLFQHAPLMFTGAHKYSDFVTHQSMHRKEAFHDVFAELQFDDHMLLTFSNSEPNSAFPSNDGDKEFGYFYFYRNWNEWTERDRLILNLIQPHINQALQSVRSFHRLDQQVDRLKEMFDYAGVILLDEQGYVQQISAQAACWLYDYCPTAYYSQQLPEPLYTWFINQVTQLNSQVNVLSLRLPPALSLRIQQENRQLTIRFNANLERRQYILLLIEEQTLSLQKAFELLGLTQREANVLLGATQGQDNKAIAAQLNISVSTVRKHLENIYLKLQVGSRTEAVMRSLEQVGLMSQL